MSSLRQSIMGFLGAAALIVLMIILMIWVILLVMKPELLGNLKNVVGPIFEVIFLGTIGTFIKRRFKGYLQETQNVSSALVRVIGGEWIIQISIWALLLVTGAYFIYTMPVYKVVVSIEQSTVYGSTEIQPPEVSLEFEQYKWPLELISSHPDSFQYESESVLHWGDSGDIIISASGCVAADTLSIPWSFLKIIGHLFEGIEIQIPRDLVEMRIQINPESAKAKIQVKTPLDTVSYTGFGVYTIERGLPFEISVSADNFISKDSVFVTGFADDATINISLSPKPGAVTFQTVNEGQQRIDSLRVYINGEFRFGFSWQKIWLTPGLYDIYMEKQYSNDEKYAVDTFQVNLRSGQDTVVKCVVNIVGF